MSLQMVGEGPHAHEVVFISIRTRFVRLILSGAKTYELRKRVPKSAEGRSLLVYSSGEDKAITAYGTISQVISGTPEEIWANYAEHLGVTSEEYLDYFRDSEIGYALKLENISPSRRPLPLSELREQHGLEPPQSWRYLSRDLYSDLLDSL